MKKIIAMILVAMLTMACFGAVAEEKKVLTVALSPDFAPMEFIDTSKSGQDQYVGFDVTLAKFIADELGMDLEIKAMSFDACQTAVQTGSVDLAISGFSWTEARAENFYLSDYYYAGDNETEQVIITTADKAGAFSTADDFSGLTVGCQDASLQADLCNSQLPTDCTIKPFKAIDDAILSLMSGKIDAVCIDDQVAKNFVAANPDSLVVLDTPYATEDYAACVAKGNDQLTEAMNAAIAELKNNGTLDAILDKYINKTEGAVGYVTPEGTEYPNGELTMATNATFEPYEYIQNGEVIGLDVDFAKAICDQMGYKLHVEDMEFDAIIPAVQSGKADFGMAGMTVTPERAESINFTDSYCTGVQSIIVLK